MALLAVNESENLTGEASDVADRLNVTARMLWLIQIFFSFCAPMLQSSDSPSSGYRYVAMKLLI